MECTSLRVLEQNKKHNKNRTTLPQRVHVGARVNNSSIQGTPITRNRPRVQRSVRLHSISRGTTRSSVSHHGERPQTTYPRPLGFDISPGENRCCSEGQAFPEEGPLVPARGSLVACRALLADDPLRAFPNPPHAVSAVARRKKRKPLTLRRCRTFPSSTPSAA